MEVDSIIYRVQSLHVMSCLLRAPWKADTEIKLQVVDLRNGAKRHQWRSRETKNAIYSYLTDIRSRDPLRCSVAQASKPTPEGWETRYLYTSSHPSLAEGWAQNQLHPYRLHLCSDQFWNFLFWDMSLKRLDFFPPIIQ